MHTNIQRGQTRGNPEALVFKIKRTALGKAHINGKILDRKGLPKASGTKEPVVGDLFAHVVKPEKARSKWKSVGKSNGMNFYQE